MRTRPLFLAAGLLASGACTPPKQGPEPAAGAADLEVRHEIDVASLRPREGDLAAVLFRIRNGSKRTVILRDLVLLRDFMLPDSNAALASWQFAQAGHLEYLQDIDEWEYDRRRAADARRPVFNSGLLLPGEQILVRTRLRLLDLPKDFQVRYFELSEADLVRKVYWEERKDRVARFRHLIGRDLELRLVPDNRTEVGSQRLVIFPHADEVGRSTLLQKSVRVAPELLPRAFTLAQAARKAGLPVPDRETYTYCSSLDAWVLPSPAGHVLVAGDGVSSLPELRQPDRVFFHVDSTGVGKLQVELAKASIATTFSERGWPVVSQQREVRISPSVTDRVTDYFVFLQAAELPRLFADARALKLALDVSLAPDGGGRLVVTR
jgi:hypothetical protein